MLTDAECRNAVCPPDKKQARFADSGGMYLQVSPAGSKRWFLKYRIAGVEKQLALGSYPVVSLAAARKARDVAHLGFPKIPSLRFVSLATCLTPNFSNVPNVISLRSLNERSVRT